MFRSLIVERGAAPVHSRPRHLYSLLLDAVEQRRRSQHLADQHLREPVAPPAPDCKTAPKGSLVNVCTSGFSGAATAIDGVVIEGSMDGKLRAHDVRVGKIVWEADLGQTSFQPVNAAAPRKGDTMNGAGATVAGGTLFQISGYQSSNATAMNLLLAFTVDGK